MGLGPVLRAGSPLYSTLVAALSQLEPDEADLGERCFRHSRLGWWPSFVGCGRENGHLFGSRHRVRFGPVVDVQRLAALM